MTPVDKRLRVFVGLLMDMPKDRVLEGRDNRYQDDFETDYIVVDDLSSSERVTGNISYDPDAEVETISSNYKTTYTIDFYGINAYDNCNTFAGLARSQKAYETKKVLEIGIYQVSSIQDIKKLTGQQYGNRYQITMKVEDCRSVDVDVLRIDTAQIEVTT